MRSHLIALNRVVLCFRKMFLEASKGRTGRDGERDRSSGDTVEEDWDPFLSIHHAVL